MTQAKVSGTFTAEGDGQSLEATFACDPTVPPTEGQPFLVYELGEGAQPPEASAIRPGARRASPFMFRPELVGCFFADDAVAACEDAARFTGRRGGFVAVRGIHVEVEFSAKAAPHAPASGQSAAVAEKSSSSKEKHGGGSKGKDGGD